MRILADQFAAGLASAGIGRFRLRMFGVAGLGAATAIAMAFQLGANRNTPSDTSGRAEGGSLLSEGASAPLAGRHVIVPAAEVGHAMAAGVLSQLAGIGQPQQTFGTGLSTASPTADDRTGRRSMREAVLLHGG